MQIYYYLSIIFLIYTIYTLFIYNYNRLIALFIFSLVNFFIIYLFVFFNKSLLWYQYYNKVHRYFLFNITYIIGLDALSLLMIVLSSFLIVICLLNYWFVKYQINVYIFSLSISLWILLNVFSILDMFYFFLFFESIVIPMFLFVGIWGSRSRKIYASYLLFIYTLFGSFFMIVAFFDIYLQQGSTNLLFFDNNSLNLYHIDRQWFIWIFLLLGFAVKIPMYPVHIWLPEAHVEAPTPGSIILAGIVLKLGSYGIIRFLYSGPFTIVSQEIVFYIYAIAIIGFIYCSLVAFNQQDLKKIIAYSSIAHMNFSILGLFSNEILGLAGAIIMAIGHGLTAASLFFGIGVLYDRYKSRIIHYYGGLVTFMPIFSIVYFIFVLSNFGFPLTSNFVGEFLLSAAILNQSLITILICNFALILTMVYSLFFYNRIFFANIKTQYINYYCDITRQETYILLLLMIMIIILGLYPNALITICYSFLKNSCL